MRILLASLILTDTQILCTDLVRLQVRQRPEELVGE